MPERLSNQWFEATFPTTPVVTEEPTDSPFATTTDFSSEVEPFGLYSVRVTQMPIEAFLAVGALEWVKRQGDQWPTRFSEYEPRIIRDDRDLSSGVATRALAVELNYHGPCDAHVRIFAHAGGAHGQVLVAAAIVGRSPGEQASALGFLESLRLRSTGDGGGQASARLLAALETIAKWMIEHGAPRLAENLADGASAQALEQLETALGFALPPDLRALWATHDGQKEELNGFIEHLDLLDTRQALGERDSVLSFVEFLRESPEDWAEAGVSDEEIQSEQWVPFAGRDSELLVVSGRTGRVFSCGKDAPPLRLIAASLVQWAEGYAARVLAEDYEVTEGFGDSFLALRDREAELRAQQLGAGGGADERYRRETPVLTQLQDALARADADRCREVFEQAASENSAQLLPRAVELLFEANASPQLTATALQVVLQAVTLSGPQWAKVEEGGRLLGNGAISEIAAERARATSPVKAPASRPWWKRLLGG